MNTAELFNPEPLFQIQDLGGTLSALSKHFSPTEPGLLCGEVVATFDGGTRAQLRDDRGAVVELRLEQALQAARGDWLEVSGAPELVAETVPVGLRVVWRGTATKNLGVSKRFRERCAFAERLASSLPFETPRINARLHTGGRLRVVTPRHSKAREAVAESARQYRWLKPEVRYHDEATKPGSLAKVLTSLLGVIRKGDVVLVAHDAGELTALELFEDPQVVEALAKLTERSATLLAVGNSGEELLANKIVTYPVETVGVAMQLVLRESGVRSIDSAAPVAAPVASGGSENESGPTARSAMPAVASVTPLVSKLRGSWTRWLLVGAAAASLGWWARGSRSQEPTSVQPPSALSAVANGSLPR